MNNIEVQYYLGDCLEVMPTLQKESIDLAIFSPPYNVGVDYDKTTDKLPVEDYSAFANETIKCLYPLMKHGGRVCVEIGGSGRNFPMSYIWQKAAYENNFYLFSEIGLEHRKTNECAWGSWLKADAVYTIPNFHMLYVFYKTTDRKTGNETTIEKREFIDWTRGYWKINWSVGAIKEHPAQFPVELPMRCIQLFGHKYDTVLDPFMGTATTGVACILSNRKFIGIEISEKYFQIAKVRLSQPSLL